MFLIPLGPLAIKMLVFFCNRTSVILVHLFILCVFRGAARGQGVDLRRR